MGFRFGVAGLASIAKHMSSCISMEMRKESCRFMSSQANRTSTLTLSKKPQVDREYQRFIDHGEVYVIWDVRNCGVALSPTSPPPSPRLVCKNVKKYLRSHGRHEMLVNFEAYGDSDTTPQVDKFIDELPLIEGGGGKRRDEFSFFIIILNAMWRFVSSVPPPSTLFLISANRDFAPFLSKLKERDRPFVAVQLNEKGKVLEWPEMHALNKKCSDEFESEPNNEKKGSDPGQLGIFWDLRRCRVPKGVRYDAVADNIKRFLTRHGINERITTFNIYGDASKLPQTFVKGCNKIGISIIDEKEQDSVRKAMLIDMAIFGIDNPVQISSKVLLISGRRSGYFNPLLSLLQAHYNKLLLAVPNLKKACPELVEDAGKYAWEWPEMAMGGYPGQDQLISSSE